MSIRHRYTTFVLLGLSPGLSSAASVGDVVISEILAANATVIADEAGEFDDWIELTNRSTDFVDLGGMFLSDDDTNPQKWEIPSVVIGPGEFLIIWADEDGSQGDFHANFKLDAQGESVMVYDTIAAGNGLLDRVPFGLQSQDISYGRRTGGANQRPDYLVPATPAESNWNASLFSDVCVNEFLTTSSGGGVDDWVELFNRSADLVDLSGWGVSDDLTLPMKYVIPPGTTISGDGFLFLDENALGFSFSSLGEEILLTGPDGVTGLDYIEFTAQVPDVTEGRFRDGTTAWFSLSPTPGATNAPPSVVVPDEGPDSIAAAPVVNPARGHASVRFTIERAGRVDAAVFDAAGRRVRRLGGRELGIGTHEIAWDGRTDNGVEAAPGRYWVQVGSVGGERSTVPITLVR